MDIGKLSARTGSPDTMGRSYRFGIIDAKEFAHALRAFAADVEDGVILPQEGRQITRVKAFDYLERTLIIRYSEKL